MQRTLQYTVRTDWGYLTSFPYMPGQTIKVLRSADRRTTYSPEGAKEAALEAAQVWARQDAQCGPNVRVVHFGPDGREEPV